MTSRRWRVSFRSPCVFCKLRSIRRLRWRPRSATSTAWDSRVDRQCQEARHSRRSRDGNCPPCQREPTRQSVAQQAECGLTLRADPSKRCAGAVLSGKRFDGMFDDTPKVRWSTAWWTKWGVGVVGALSFLGVSVYGFLFQHSFGIGAASFKIWFFPVSGQIAILMSVAHLGLALTSFAYGFCRYSSQLYGFYEPLLALGLLAAAFGTIGSNIAPILGYP